MGYFSNGDEGRRYEAEYCDHCINQNGCFIWDLHMSRNYEDCNNPDSILHVLIPRSADRLSNEQCVMFRNEVAEDEDDEQPGCGYCKSEDMEIKHEPWCRRTQ